MASGSVQYTNRAFEQDGDYAMRGDIVRALIELITNADDAYRGRRGSIRIVVARNDETDFPLRVSVSDSAVGMSLETMMEKFTVIGGDNEAFVLEKAGRGLLGRGAKDVASLGRVEFESIKNNKFSSLVVKRNGDWNSSEQEIDATLSHREKLILSEGESGLTATMFLRKSVNVPKTNDLISRLATNCQLRELVQRCDVHLTDTRKNKIDAAIVFSKPDSTLAITKTLEVPGYDGEVSIELNVLEDGSQEVLSAESPHGVLIKSETTIYENTLFGLESKPFANLITGVVTAPQINEIIRDYIKNDDGSGTSLISRSRDGLVPEHAFRKALWKVCGSEVAELLKTLESERAKTDGQGEKLTNDLKDAAAAVAQEFSRLRDEIDGETSNSGEGYVDADIDVIPGRVTMNPNSSQTLSVRVKPKFASQVFASMANASSEITVSVPDNTVWREHPRLDLLVTNVVVAAGTEVEVAVLLIRVGELSAAIDINVREFGPTEPVPPAGLEIIPSVSKIAPTRTKRITVRAPIEFSDHEIQLETSGVALISEPSSVILRPAAEGNWVQANAKFQAGVDVGQVQVRAFSESVGDASATIEIAESQSLAGTNFEIKLHRGERTARRAVLDTDESGSYVIRINTDHPATNGVFGKFDEVEGKYEFEDSDNARLLIAEVCSQVLAENLVELDSLKRPAYFQDAQSFFIRASEIAAKFVSIVFKALKVNG